MYCPWLHKWIDRLSNIKWLLAPQRIVIACSIIALIGVGFEYGPDLPGCGGPLLPTPTVRPTDAPPATATVAPTTPSTSTPRPTLVPTPLSTPVSPLPTATPPQSPVPGAGE